MNHKRVLVTEPIHPVGIELLEARDDVEVIHAPDTSEATLIESVKDVDAILARATMLPASVLSHAGKLQVISRHGVGCDSVDVAHCTSRGITVAIASGANARSVAEHTLMFTLAVARDLRTLDNVVREKRWRDRDKYRAVDLFGANMLILGFGRIGKIVAELCRGFGMNVTVADIQLDHARAAALGCETTDDFKTALADADFMSLHVPLDDVTRHMINDDVFGRMKPGSILINCARGGIVDEAALERALESGNLRGAGIDVFGEEPPADNHPLIAREDVIMAPHNGAASALSAFEMSRMAGQNILDHFDGCLADDCVFNQDVLGEIA